MLFQNKYIKILFIHNVNNWMAPWLKAYKFRECCTLEHLCKIITHSLTKYIRTLRWKNIYSRNIEDLHLYVFLWLSNLAPCLRASKKWSTIHILGKKQFFTFFYINWRKYWFRENVRLPVFDGLTRFGMSWIPYWKMPVCVCVTKILWQV